MKMFTLRQQGAWRIGDTVVCTGPHSGVALCCLNILALIVRQQSELIMNVPGCHG